MSVDKILRELASLFNDIDVSDLEDNLDDLDIESNTNVRNIRSSASSGRGRKKRNSNRRKSSRHDKSGKEKFELKRKIKRINRKIKELERNGGDFTDLIEGDDDGHPDADIDTDDPLIRWNEFTDSYEVIVDETGAELSFDSIADGESTLARITFPENDSIDVDETSEIDIVDPTYEKSVNQGIVVFTITASDVTDGDGAGGSDASDR